ncbi:MAG: hypothetical protein F4Z25_12155 [Chloroflexi bacterium]|nr:hypothetical protein [Chloroflexota bacterium]
MAIDLTDRYFATEFMRGGMARWKLDRDAWPVRAIVLHHAAGWYGPPLGPDASRREEEERVHSLARDHHARFGIGPGYHYVAFPSGRLYAVGKAGTHRAHTKGRNPETGRYWNVEAIGVCALGDYEHRGRDDPTPGLRDAIEEAVEEIRGFRFTLPNAPVFGHGATPTVDASGDSAPQATSCPGRRLTPLLEALNRPAPPDVSAELAAIRAAAEAIERKLRAA